MNEKTRNSTPGSGDDELRRLLQTAGPRREVPAAELAAIKASARRDWRRLVDGAGDSGRLIGSSRWRSGAALALAATLLLALAVGWWWRGRQQPVGGAAIAAVELAEGATRSDGSPLAAGDELAPGAEIVTAGADGAPVRLALRLAGGQSARLDADSRLRLIAASTLELASGAVYIDSRAAQPLAVRTALGSVYDVGTQFEVRVAAGEGLRVRVREGSIEVERGADRHPAVAGEELTMRSDGSLERRPLPPWHSEWDWVVEAAPPLASERPLVSEYLAWVARETGWRVRFADRALADSMAGVRVSGSIREHTPSESVHVVMPALGLEYRLENGMLLIEP